MKFLDNLVFQILSCFFAKQTIQISGYLVIVLSCFSGVKHHFQQLSRYIPVVSPPNSCSWVSSQCYPISPQGTDFLLYLDQSYDLQALCLKSNCLGEALCKWTRQIPEQQHERWMGKNTVWHWQHCSQAELILRSCFKQFYLLLFTINN